MADEQSTIIYMSVEDKKHGQLVPHEVQQKFDEKYGVVINCFTVHELNKISYKSQLWILGKQKEQGRFSISGKGFYGEKTTSVEQPQIMDLNISIEDEQQGNGYSNYLVHALCEYILANTHGTSSGLNNKEIIINYLLLIDTDASEGYWDKIGMIPNRRENSKRANSSGYEKSITFRELHNYAKYKLKHYVIMTRKHKSPHNISLNTSFNRTVKRSAKRSANNSANNSAKKLAVNSSANRSANNSANRSAVNSSANRSAKRLAVNSSAKRSAKRPVKRQSVRKNKSKPRKKNKRLRFSATGL